MINRIDSIISFATLKSGYIMPNAHARWNKQMEYLVSRNFVGNAKIFSEFDLDDEWNSLFGKYVSDHAYAYWAWKPYLINKAFQKLEYGGSLCYFDGGCVLPENPSELDNTAHEILTVMNDLETTDKDLALTIGWCGQNRWYPCGCAVRKEITDKFQLSSDENFLIEFPHWQAGLILCRKTEKSEKLMKDWLKFFIDNYETCIHFPFMDRTGQIPMFMHNGADQAILQCLLYKNNYNVLNIDNFHKYYSRNRS